MLRQLTYIASWLATGVLVILGVVIVAATTPIFGAQSLIVRSGSMAPAMNVGDLVGVRPQSGANYAAGNVIAFYSEKNQSLITTHRIVEVVQQDSQSFYRTQGDANTLPDESLVPAERVLGKKIVVLPQVGKVLAFSKTTPGFVSLVVAPILLLIISEVFTILREWRKERLPIFERAVFHEESEPAPVFVTSLIEQAPKRSTTPRYYYYGSPLGARQAVDSLVRVGVLMLVFLGLGVSSTNAFISDTETSSSNTFIVAFDQEEESSTAADHVMISEIKINGPTGATTHDFVELYNPTGTDINLDDWQLKKRTASGTESSLVLINGEEKVIPAHGFFLWANEDSGLNTDVSNGSFLSNNNSVALFNPSDVIIDQVSWGPGGSGIKFIENTAYPTDPGPGESIERKALSGSTASSMGSGGSDEFKGNGFDSDNNANDFVLRGTAQPQNSFSTPETL